MVEYNFIVISVGVASTDVETYLHEAPPNIVISLDTCSVVTEKLALPFPPVVDPLIPVTTNKEGSKLNGVSKMCVCMILNYH